MDIAPSLQSCKAGSAVSDAELKELTLSQRQQDGDYGLTQYMVVVLRGEEEVCTHEYACYHPQAGPVRPDKVTNLRLEAGNVLWDWSENAFDLASPGASFTRPLQRGKHIIEWGGPVVRHPNDRIRPNVADHVPPAPSELLPQDVKVDSHCENRGFGDEVKIIVTHVQSGTSLEWEGTSTAEFQDIRNLETRADKGFLWIEFVYTTSENGMHAAHNVALRVGREGGNLAWMQK